jgi:hypothetical protein
MTEVRPDRRRRAIRGHVGLRAGAVLALATGLAACDGLAGTASAPPGSPGSSATATNEPAGSPSRSPGPSSSEPAIPVLPTTAVALDGDGPLGLDLDAEGGIAWLVAFDSGELIGVDIRGQSGQRTIAIGPGGSHVVAGPDEVLVSRIEAGASGEHLLIVDTAGGSVRGLVTPSLAGLDRGDDGRIWLFGNAGEVLVTDAAGGSIQGQTSIAVNDLEHLDAVFGAGAFWASSDTTAVRRLEGPVPAVSAEIETGGGIPLAFADGLVWGARADELWAIDPATDTVSRRIPLEGLIEILDLDVAGGEAWIAARRPGRVGTVVGVDLETGGVIGEAAVRLPAGVAIEGDVVWATDYEAGELVAIDTSGS